MLYDVVGNALDTLITIGSKFEHIVAQYYLPHYVNTIVFIYSCINSTLF